jgi:hypothetical protein
MSNIPPGEFLFSQEFPDDNALISRLDSPGQGFEKDIKDRYENNGKYDPFQVGTLPEERQQQKEKEKKNVDSIGNYK